MPKTGVGLGVLVAATLFFTKNIVFTFISNDVAFWAWQDYRRRVLAKDPSVIGVYSQFGNENTMYVTIYPSDYSRYARILLGAQ